MLTSTSRCAACGFLTGLVLLMISVARADERPAAAGPPPSGEPAVYDPLKIGDEKLVPQDMDVQDSARSRTIPIRVYLPSDSAPAPVVLFSHGLGGNREGSGFLGRHWAARGYVTVFLQHPGSDESVWRDTPLRERAAALQSAANGENFRLRTQDVVVVLDELTRWNTDPSHVLHGRLDLDKVGMSGHSFGAVTTQAVSGQSFLGRQNLTDQRIRAAVIMSPGLPKIGNPDRAFGSVSIPWLLLTGTKDDSTLFGTDAASRMRVFPALSPGRKYELVLHEAEHSVFTERALPGESGRRNPNHHRAILAISTAFWDACLRDDRAAREWLDTESAVRGVLEADDRWQRK